MSEVAKLKEQIAKSREDLKAAFDEQEDGKYTACLLYTSDAADE